MVVAHTFNPSTWEQRQADIREFEVSLVCKVSSRTGSKAIEKPCFQNEKV